MRATDKSNSFKSFFSEVGGGEGDRCNYPTRLDTYGCGCAHQCNYCFARALLDFRKNWHPDNPSVASASDISKALKKVKRGQILRLGGMTVCEDVPAHYDYWQNNVNASPKDCCNLRKENA